MAKYVAYYLSPSRPSGHFVMSQKDVAPQESMVREFIQADPGRQLISAYVEQGSFKRNRSLWDALDKAIAECRAEQAHLVIPQFKKVIMNEAFIKRLLLLMGKTASGTDVPSFSIQQFVHHVICLDFPSMNRENFSAILQHEQRQRQEHRRRIMMGLKNPNAKKSGNPNAAQVINQVNWPKVNNAIIFALHLQPIIESFQRQNLSQRKMVQALNEQGIFAPEGGKWVLSQLQKVIDRIKVNQAAVALEQTIDRYLDEGYSPDEIADKLQDEPSTPPPIGKTWTPDAVHKVVERLRQFDDIIAFNQFVVSAKPILAQFPEGNLTPTAFRQALQERGVEVPDFLEKMCQVEGKSA